jgi:threonine synthase
VSFVSHLEGAIDGARLPAGTVQTLHEDRPIWVRYDLAAVSRAVPRTDLAERPPTMWRYRELLPVADDANIVSLGEGMSPLLDCPGLAAELGVARLQIKDESQLPTGSFKSRGQAAAVSMAKELGITRLAIPTAGNAGGAMAAYAARAGMEAFVFMPQDTPIVNQLEAALFGAKAFLVNGLITDCAGIVAAGRERMGWFDLSTLKEPYRIEGKKTMGLELAEQLDWSLPDAIFYPTGGGTGLIGMWKAFAELAELGWLETVERPRMFSCQSSGCATLPPAFEAGERFARQVENPHTLASGLRVPKAIGDFMILDAVRESGGRAMATDEGRLLEWAATGARLSGVSVCPETGACLGAVAEAVREGWLSPDDHVVVFNTGAAQKYVETLPAGLPRIDHTDVDWVLIEA